MQAWTHTKSGHPSHILKLSDVTKPSLKSPTDVLIQVSHVALHPGASIFMQLCPFIFRGTPAIPETDFSGVIVEAGEDIDPSRRLYPGSEVFGSIPVKQQ
jgi:NADPH:quinone reductase-like Zn-dependent oxidoreductase